LVGAVIATYGRQAAANWLQGLKANAALYPDEEAVTAAVDRGQQPVGVVNQYYWYRLRLEQGATNTHSKLYFFPNHDVGDLTNISGAAILASSHNKSGAESFLRFLVSPEAQQILARSNDFEYPARGGVPPNGVLTPLSKLNPAMLSVVKLGDDQRSASLLQQVGLG
jgi:iron(III) transport system substrate-binding protein